MATVPVVDDEPDNAESDELWLREAHDVRVATSGEDALDALDDAINVGLLDRLVPDLSGDEVVAEIADRDVDAGVVLITAVDPDIDIVNLEFDR
jgi:DNA-binding NtrC family response regulator